MVQRWLLSGVLAQAAESAPINWTPTIIVSVGCLIALLVFSYTTKAGIIARATTKEAVRQPVFWLCMGLALVLLVVNTFLPFFSLGDDVKMQKDCGLATILISSLLIAVWTASTSVAEEIEGKTAMTLLSKPINRRQFVLGKYIGIVQAVLWVHRNGRWPDQDQADALDTTGWENPAVNPAVKAHLAVRADDEPQRRRTRARHRREPRKAPLCRHR